MNNKNRKIAIYLVIFSIISLTFTETMAIDNNRISNFNEQIYLGYANISGDGNSSILDGSAENDLSIGIDSTTEMVDFYIDYDIACEAVFDFGIVGLTIYLNDLNTSFNVTLPIHDGQGTLHVKDVEVSRGDILLFAIGLSYANPVNQYHNETVITGAGVINKQLINHPVLNQILNILDRFQIFHFIFNILTK
jgi:hypothetical protein